MSSDKFKRSSSPPLRRKEGAPNNRPSWQRKGEGASPNESQPTTPKPRSKSFGIEIAILVIGITAIAMYLFVPRLSFSGLFGNDQSAHNVLVIDSVAIENAKKAQLQESISDYAQVLREAQSFSRDLHQILAAYREAGIIVLNRHAVIAMPDAVDITNQVARELNVALPDFAQ